MACRLHSRHQPAPSPRGRNTQNATGVRCGSRDPVPPFPQILTPGAGIRYRRGFPCRRSHGRRLFRLPAHAGWFLGHISGRCGRTRNGTRPPHGGNPILPSHDGPVGLQPSRNPDPSQPTLGRRPRRRQLRDCVPGCDPSRDPNLASRQRRPPRDLGPRCDRPDQSQPASNRQTARAARPHRLR